MIKKVKNDVQTVMTYLKATENFSGLQTKDGEVSVKHSLGSIKFGIGEVDLVTGQLENKLSRAVDVSRLSEELQAKLPDIIATVTDIFEYTESEEYSNPVESSDAATIEKMQTPVIEEEI